MTSLALDLAGGPLAEEAEALTLAIEEQGITPSAPGEGVAVLAAGRVPPIGRPRIAWLDGGRADGADLVLAPGPASAAALGADELAPGIDHRHFRPGLPSPRTSRDHIFLTRGRWGPASGLDLLLPCFVAEFAPADRVGLLVLLACDSHVDLRAEIDGLDLPRGRAPVVTFLAHLGPAELSGVMAGADAYVSLQREDGFWLDVRRAMACGLPVVAPGERDCPLTDETGFPLGSGDATTLRRTLRLVAEDRGAAQARGAHAADAATAWAWPRVASRLAELVP